MDTQEVAVKHIRIFPSDYAVIEREMQLMGRRATIADVIREWRSLLGK